MSWKPTLQKLIALAILSAVAGCGARQTNTKIVDRSADSKNLRETSATPVEPPRLGSTIPHPEVVVVPLGCDATAQETCNAVDDNCNGVIDEGCGYRSGSLQVTVGWDNGADVDVYLRTPNRDLLSFQRKRTPDGGRVDHIGRGDCDRTIANPRVENVRWINASPPKGTYELTLHYWGSCLTDGAPALITFSIGVGQVVIGPFQYSLASNERVQVFSFEVL